MRYKQQIFGLILVLTFFSLVGAASAHVVVQPSQVGIASFQIFTVNVPTEKNNPTVALKLVVPAGLDEVTPTVKAGWQITTKKDAKDTVTEIDWTGGEIPVGLRDEFTFSAQAPPSPTDLHWKAYQTYQDGSVVSWDATPNGSDDASGDKGPYSTTKVVNDLAPTTSTTPKDIWPYVISSVALLLGIVSLALSIGQKRK